MSAGDDARLSSDYVEYRMTTEAVTLTDVTATYAAFERAVDGWNAAFPERSRPLRLETELDTVLSRANAVRDTVAAGGRVLFVGINPGVYSTAVGHHFARPGNRFWPALALSFLTPQRFAPSEDRKLLALGMGITNVVARTTARADELDEVLNALPADPLAR